MERQKVASITISSKNFNFRITSIYISLSKETIKEEIKKLYSIQTNEKDFYNKYNSKIDGLLSYEIIYGLRCDLFFDFNNFNKCFNYDFEHYLEYPLPIPYIIHIHIRDLQKKESENYFKINLKVDNIINVGNVKRHGINIKLINGHKDFNFINPIAFCFYEIYHKSEEYWKMNEIQKMRKYI